MKILLRVVAVPEKYFIPGSFLSRPRNAIFPNLGNVSSDRVGEVEWTRSGDDLEAAVSGGRNAIA